MSKTLKQIETLGRLRYRGVESPVVPGLFIEGPKQRQPEEETDGA